MAAQRRILFALSDAYGSFGGISKFNRDLLAALDATLQVERTFALPRIIPGAINEPIPKFVVFDRQASRGKAAFLSRALVTAAQRKPDLVICGHLHLLPIAFLAAKLARAQLALIIHGMKLGHLRGIGLQTISLALLVS